MKQLGCRKGDKMREIDWLLEGEKWIEYRTRIDLLGESFSEDEELAFLEGIASNDFIRQIIEDLDNWLTTVMKNHKDSKHPIHKLAFLADIGMNAKYTPFKQIMSDILGCESQEGLFQVLANIPGRFGGTGKDEFAWMLCDAPTVLYALVKMDSTIEKDNINAIRYLCSVQDDNGWRCKVSDNLGKFRGPGKKTDPCPYANLLMLKLIAELETNEFDKEADIGINSILDLWEHRSERKEYLFGMGTDFKKVKAPFIWFDILHVLDVLSKYPKVFEDRRFKEILGILTDKLDKEGRLRAESIYMPWKSWEFSNKKEHSRWLTFLGYRILKRVEAI